MGADTLLDLTEQVNKDLRSWNPRRGALNFHPGFEIIRIERALEMPWNSKSQVIAGVAFRNTYAPAEKGCSLQLLALAKNHNGKLRCVQWYHECCLALKDNTILKYDESMWTAELPFGKFIEAIFYVDQKKQNRVDHDPVPPVHCLAIAQVRIGEAEPEALAKIIAPQLPRCTWSFGENDGVVAEAECLRLRDPMSMQVITTPVRPRGCEHAQCFDLVALLGSFLQHRSKNLSCIVCDSQFDMSDLAIDTNFVAFSTIMSQLKKSDPAIRRTVEDRGDITIPSKIYQSLGDGTPIAERTASIRDILTESQGLTQNPVTGVTDTVDLDSDVDISVVSDDSHVAAAAPPPRQGQQAQPPAKRQRRLRPLIEEVVGGTGEAIKIGGILAFLCPGTGLEGHTIYVAVVEGVSPPDAEGSSQLTVREMRSVLGTEQQGQFYPFYIPGRATWRELNTSAVPITGRWVHLARADQVDGNKRGFELAEGEQQRLASLQLDMSGFY
eukprot:TRINITY_DN39417_c0_g1_i1.p1 TRINITY_DN39417_c0_g1~~TRINITY_DN39417_c0_g1_i1.p1  ORF type:complete len:497 (+),score=150.71 TRINITY_DN39417_c0_g1_i1:81-1571(+)